MAPVSRGLQFVISSQHDQNVTNEQLRAEIERKSYPKTSPRNYSIRQKLHINPTGCDWGPQGDAA